MALVVADRVQETTSTTGTSDYVLLGAAAGYQSFGAVLANADTTYYAITNDTDWEVGIGTYSTTGPTLARTTILASSNGGSAVNWGVGVKNIFISYAASKASFFDANGDLPVADKIVHAGDTDTAIRFPSANTMSVETGGTERFKVENGTITTTVPVLLPADPTLPLQAATKEYVDTIASAGIQYHAPVRVESPINLNATYNNGTSGVGATLTNAGTQVALVIDGVTVATNDRVLVYTQTNQTQNGVYVVTDTGSGSTNWVLTRSTDTDSYGPSDPEALGTGDAFFVQQGATGAGELYVCNTAGTITFGTTNITFTQIAATAVYTAGSGLTLTGTEFSNAAPDQTVTLTQGGATTITGTYPNFTITSTDTTYSAGNGIGLAGTTFSVAAGSGLTQDASGLSHADTSSQASVDNTGATFVQDINLDGFGHVTGLASVTVTPSLIGAPQNDGTGATGTWNISISGNAANVTGTVAVGNGGTGATTTGQARTNLDVPSTTGGGASGTWNISISGNAATATSATTATSVITPTFSGDSTDKADITTRTDSGFYETDTGTTAEGWPRNDGTWQHMLAVTHSNDSNYYSMQLAGGFFSQQWYMRNTNGTGTTGWSELLTSASYTSYSPSLTGSGASGTWGINISGNAATASNATAATYSSIQDTRSGALTPNDYSDYRVSYEFTNQVIGGDWHTAITSKGWSDGYTAWQIWGPSSTGAHENWYLRSGVNTTWNPLRTILHSGNYTSYTAARNGSGYLIPDNWTQLNGLYGLYSSTNNAHIMPNNSSYGSWKVIGTRNGWAGLEFEDSGTSLMQGTDGNNSGFHRNGYGWQFYWSSGTLYCFKNTYGGGTQATVLDTSNVNSILGGLSYGSVGTYAFLGSASTISGLTTVANPGDTIAGSSYRAIGVYAFQDTGAQVHSSALAGTWRVMGFLRNISSNAYQVGTVMLRIA